MSFANLGLSPDLLRAVAEEGYTIPTPIQLQAIPLILEGRDLLAAAQTGTGKTAAFVLPIFERLRFHANSSFSPARHPVRVLVLTPTRELCMQVEQMAIDYGRYVPLRVASVFGGVPIEPQLKELRAGVEFLVATPGRLLDHVGQRTVNLGQVEILVLDEADRMLDMGFIPDIRKILALLPDKRQNLLFSATFNDEVRSLSSAFMSHPATVEVAPRNTTLEAIRQIVYPVDRDRKEALLAHLIRRDDLRQVLVFTRTKIAASRLAARLDRDGIEAVAIHSDRTQPERTRALEAFKNGELRVLVATDVAARGLDIEDLPHVVNFELPPHPQDYIHRIGRTGRAGATGEAISLVSLDEAEYLRAIQRLLRKAIPWQVEEGFVPHRDREDPPEPARPPRGGSGSRGGGRSSGGGAPPRRSPGRAAASG
ncbi:MAG TPA: DEAD/DEAH box helicase [Candidatus Limnocylindrales bacterium]